MKLSDQQYIFAKDLIHLAIYIRDDEEVTKFSIGEVWRPFEWQEILVKKGFSQTLDSDHLNKMAVDIYFWIDGKFVKNEWESKPLLDEIGEYWEALNTLNYWGGNFKSFCDMNHFGRKLMASAMDDTD